MTPEKSVLCPICSAENAEGSARCFLCGQSLVGAEVSLAKKPGIAAPEPHRPSFHLNSLMLVIALIAVFLGVAHEAPGLAMLLAVPGTIALIRTFTVAGRWPDRPSWYDHVAVFLGTFAAVVTVAIAAVISFFVTCLAIVATGTGPYGGNNFGVGLVVGGIVGVAVLIGLTVVFVRRGRRTRTR